MPECLTLGGGHDLPWHIIVGELKSLADREQATIHGTFNLEGTLVLEGSSQLIIEN